MKTSPPQVYVIPVLSAANFVVGMGAFMVIGMLNPLAEEFAIPAATAGWLMIAYALGYAVLSPLLVSATGGYGRRRVLAAGLGVFALSNLAASVAPNHETLTALRVLAAAGAGLITPVAASVAAGLSAPERQARVLAAVFFGFTLSQVLGVPAGGFIAYTFGWRAAFLLVFLLSLPVIALIWKLVPRGLSFRPVSLRDLGRIVASPPHMLRLSFASVFVGATYVVFTYISPLLSRTMGFGRDEITLLLTLFGLGAVAGNIMGGQLTDRIGPFRTLALLCVVQAAILPWYSFLPLPVPAILSLSFAWSAFGWSFNPAQQVRLIGYDARNAPVLLALNAASIYVGTAIGSWIGAIVIGFAGLDALGLTAGMVLICALVLLIVAERARPRIAT